MRPAPARSIAARGFTLIEVLAALVIVALGMIAAIQAVTQSARNGTYLRDKTLAHWIGMNVLTERRLQSTPPDVAESNGRVEFANQQWQWSMKVTQTQVQSLRRIDIAVRRAETPDGTALANVSGFYGDAVGGAGSGGSGLVWAGTGATGSSGGDGGDGGDEGGGTDDSAPTPTKPPVKAPGLPTDDEE
jgi:general secretion pathway protein I